MFEMDDGMTRITYRNNTTAPTMRNRLLVRAQAAMANLVRIRQTSAIVTSLTPFMTAFLQTSRFSATAMIILSKGGRPRPPYPNS